MTRSSSPIQQPEVVKRFADQGLDVETLPAPRFQVVLKDEIARWVPVIKASGATVD